MLLCLAVRFLDLESFLEGRAGSAMVDADEVVAEKEATSVVEDTWLARFFTGALLRELSLLIS